MHRFVRYIPKTNFIHSFSVLGSSQNKGLAPVDRLTSSFFIRGYSTESDSDINVDYGNYSIILPPENAPVGVAHHKIRDVTAGIARPHYATQELGTSLNRADNLVPHRKGKTSRLGLGTDEERRMRRACKLAKETLEFAGSLIKVGATTEHMDATVHQFITSRGAYPSPLRYLGFPKSICISVNNIVSHGIPDDRPLEDGDIINIDVTVYLDGFHGDTSRSFAVGSVDAKGRHLLETAQQALKVGIDACGPGIPFRTIGEAIHSFTHGLPLPTRQQLAVPNSRDGRPQYEEVIYSICTEFTGHGIGTEFHMRPWIIHTKNEEPEVMSPGDCFTIEPIILQRSHSEGTGIFLWNDGWTASTDNAARGAVFEHTVMITEHGVDILTV